MGRRSDKNGDFEVFINECPLTIKVDHNKHRVGDAPPPAALAACARGHRPQGAMPTTRLSLPSLLRVDRDQQFHISRPSPRRPSNLSRYASLRYLLADTCTLLASANKCVRPGHTCRCATLSSTTRVVCTTPSSLWRRQYRLQSVIAVATCTAQLVVKFRSSTMVNCEADAECAGKFKIERWQ
eukprot:4855250-Pleurochrysis_carterae.AAC.2